MKRYRIEISCPRGVFSGGGDLELSDDEVEAASLLVEYLNSLAYLCVKAPDGKTWFVPGEQATVVLRVCADDRRGDMKSPSCEMMDDDIETLETSE